MDRAVRVKISCPCGHVYSVLLERRKYFRKQTNLAGDCYFGTKKNRTPITVKDISRVGLKFELERNEKLNIGDVVSVEFRLDDRHSSKIKKDVRVRKISGQIIGGEFVNLDPTSSADKALGFYLF
jgi:c-di-GMP-binding flagellar brake protein YcgR